MIAIVGGGITGLSLGWELLNRGSDFVVLEAGGAPGGVIRSGVIDGRVVDWGPQRTRLTPTVARAIDASGLRDRVLTAPSDLRLYVYRDSRLRPVPFSVAELVASDVVSSRAKARLLFEPFTAAADPEERVSEFFSRKLGREIYETLVAPLYGGLYASDPADMVVGSSLMHMLRQLSIGRSLLLPLLRRGGRVDPPPACSFPDGMQELPLAIGHALGDRLRLNTPVTGLRPRGSGWRVECADDAVDCEAVVVCTDASAATELMAVAAPRAASTLGALRYNPLAIVHMDAETELRGLGFQVAFTEPRLLLRGVTFNDSLFGRRNLYTAYLGGARHPEVEEMSDDEVAGLAVREFAGCTGYDASALAVRRAHMPAWDASWSAIRDLELPRGLHAAGSWRSRPGLPGRLAEAAAMAEALVSGEAASARAAQVAHAARAR